MFRPLSLYIGLRYTRAKKRQSFVSFISLASMLGIALGVTVLITVLSVMNGFDHEIRSRIFSMARHVTINFTKDCNWPDMQKKLADNSQIIASAPFISGQGMIAKDGRAQGVLISGILPQQEAKISNLHKTVNPGSMTALKPGEFGIVLGATIATTLNADIGDKVILITPSIVPTPIGIEPRYKKFTVVGVFHASEGSSDSSVAFIELSDAQKLFMLGNNVSGLYLKIKDLYLANTISQELEDKLGDASFVSNWTNDYGALFKAIKMEKTMIFIILLFIIAVAAFNLISSLVMSVNDKQSDIAILRTLGATPKLIMGIFMIQGLIVGAVGTLVGVVCGILLSLNAPYLVNLLEQIFHTSFISASVYFGVDSLPSLLVWSDVWHVGLITLLMSLLATIYPALKAAKTNPAEALRYE